MSNADGKSIFKIKDYVTNSYTPTFIPTLEKDAATIEQKFAELRKSFFPRDSNIGLLSCNWSAVKY